MKICIVVFSLLCLGCASIQEGTSTTLSSSFISKYELFNGVVVHDEPVVQTDLTTTLPSGIQLGIWHSTGLNDDNLSSDFGDEIDYTIGWSGEIGKTDVSVGVSYFDIFELGHRANRVVDVIRPYLAASQSYEITETQTLGPIAKLEGRMRAKGDANSGATLWLGAHHGWELERSLSLKQELQVIGDTGSLGFEDIILGRYDAGLTYRLSESAIWNIFSLTVTTPLTSAENGQETSEAYGTGLSFSF